MPTLYLTSQGAQVRCHNRCLSAFHKGEMIRTIPIEEIERVICLGRIEWTASALAAMLVKGASISLHSARGKFRGMLLPAGPVSRQTLRRQCRIADDSTQRLSLSKALVQAKISGMIQTLERYRKQLDDCAERIKQLRRRKGVAGVVDSTKVLLGVEGSASREYFSAFRKLVPPPWTFARRSFHPPKDPVNSLLSFGYSLVAGELVHELHAVGLDPHIGFLHIQQRKSPALALDLLELFRSPVVDRFVLRVLRLRQIKSEDFDSAGKGSTWLTPEGRKRFLACYDAYCNDPAIEARRLFRVTAQCLAKAVDSGDLSELDPWREKNARSL